MATALATTHHPVHGASWPSEIAQLRERGYDSRIIVAGSRGYANRLQFARTMNRYLRAEHYDWLVAFLSGRAPSGADRLIYDWCKTTPFRCFSFYAAWDLLGKRAGMLRNHEMGDEATHLLAFWNGRSPGTRDMINYALSIGLVTHVAYLDESVPALSFDLIHSPV